MLFGDSGPKYCFGDSESELEEYAWFRKNTTLKGEKYAHEVATKKPNKWGLYDMHGNVWEWCEDWYDSFYGPRIINPITTNGTYRVTHGGGWDYDAKRISSFSRTYNWPDQKLHTIGFRLAMTPEK